MIIAKPHVKEGYVAIPGTASVERMSWAKLLARVLAIDMTRCPGCGATLAPEDCELVTAPFIVNAVLHALGLYGRAPARAPPRSLFEDDVNQEHAFPD